jgi:hypothetical protein
MITAEIWLLVQNVQSMQPCSICYYALLIDCFSGFHNIHQKKKDLAGYGGTSQHSGD